VRAVHLAHAAGVDGRDDLVRAEPLPRRELRRVRPGPGRLLAGGHDGRRLLEEGEAGRRAVVSEQRLDLAAQGLVAPAGRGEERRALVALALERRVIEPLDLLEPLGVRQAPSGRLR
jgi:hypothetical protein